MAFITSIIPSIQMNSGILGELGVILISEKFLVLLNIFSHSQSARLPVFLTYPYRVGERGEGMNQELQRFN